MSAAKVFGILCSQALFCVNAETADLAALEPAIVWKHFDRVRQIPRCSNNEKGMLDYVRSAASGKGLVAVQDAAGNLIVKRPPLNSGRGASAVIIQTHLDMVCEKSVVSTHNFKTDPIEVAIEDGWVKAVETTLGADNGIGVSMALGLMSSHNYGHLPPLEFLFTVQEESGLDGAMGLDTSLLSGKLLLNFDSEEYGSVYIGSAGGGDVSIDLPVQWTDVPDGMKPFRLVVKGLKGGHSGADIHLGRGNAVVLLARALAALIEETPDVRVRDIKGGNLDNAIPREASASLFCTVSGVAAAQAVVSRLLDDFLSIFGSVDPLLEINLQSSSADTAGKVLTFESASSLVDLLLVLPHGPLRYSSEVPGLVETSNNLARVRQSGQDNFEVLCFARSSLRPSLEHARDSMRRAAQRVGATAMLGKSFPGWAPNSRSPLLQHWQDCFEEVEGRRATVAAIHAGLECGVIGEAIPGIDMVSYGPDIVGAHAPGERVHIESVLRTWKMTETLLVRLAHIRNGTSPKEDL
eukprot:TRINITY_DN76468_c0_g1_i1.p1 TRINITY_DN76468_c0_g1~~TRINITY_DN76468_c0_g1_i1.p1  ORF type:complete len:522 (+),score=57.53 TRINITY_DN76468_c0_g1_i1:82-1647(+)